MRTHPYHVIMCFICFTCLSVISSGLHPRVVLAFARLLSLYRILVHVLSLSYRLPLFSRLVLSYPIRRSDHSFH